MILEACLAALLTGQTADLLTTRHVIEGNPFLPHTYATIVAVKASATTALVLAGWHIRHTHRRLAAGLFLAGAVSGSLGAWHNAHLQRHL